MNKKIIALALAGAFVTPLAMADVTLYGFISAAVEGASATGAGSNTTATNEYVTRSRVSDQNSRIGFKGTEDLGNGTKAIWQIESSLKNFEQGGVSDKGESATFATRNSFIGLSDATFGTVQMGNYDSAYKRLTNVGANVMADTTADTMGASDGSDIASRGDTRMKNSVHYTSPNWNGIQLGASYGFDESTAPGVAKRSRWNLAAGYTDGGLKLGIGYDRTGNTGAKLGSGNNGASNTGFTTQAVNGVDTSFYKLAASYKFDTGTLIAASYEHAAYGSPTGSGSKLGQTDYTLAIAQDIGAATIKASYNKLGGLSNTTDGSSSNDWGAKQWVLGATYNLSKQTQLLAYYTTITNNSNQNVNFAVNPLYSTPTTSAGGTTTALSAHNTLKALGAGLKFSF